MLSNKPSKKSKATTEKSVAPQSEQIVQDSKPAKRTTKKSIAAVAAATTPSPKKTLHKHSKINSTVAPAGTPLSVAPAVALPIALAEIPSPEPISLTPDHEEVARLAYSFWEKRNYADGFAEEDWFHAVKVLSAAR